MTGPIKSAGRFRGQAYHVAMSQPACWLFFWPREGLSLFAEFAGHTHDEEYIGDCPAGGYLVPCDHCYVDTVLHVLTYNVLIDPISQLGIVTTLL